MNHTEHRCSVRMCSLYIHTEAMLQTCGCMRMAVRLTGVGHDPVESQITPATIHCVLSVQYL